MSARMGRQSLSLRRILIAVSACAAVACGLDTSGLGEIARPDASSTTKGSPIDASVSPTSVADGAAPPGVGTDDAAFEDVEQPDVHILDPDAAFPDSGDECDLDEDGYRSSSAECGGTDCCDFDSRAYPAEPKYYGTADACGSFDYDCNGKDDLEFPVVNCQYGLPCGGSGFDKAPPACGASATFDTCNFALFFCAQAQSTVTEDCK